MRIFVDGNDLARAMADEESERLSRPAGMPGRDEVARWAARYADVRGCDVDLIFDQPPPGGVLPRTERVGRVRLAHLPEGEEALREIAGPANRAAESDRVFVVTDDPRLAGALAHGKARVVGAADFLERVRRSLRGEAEDGLDEPDEKYSGLTEDEVEYWLRLFEEKGD